MKSSINNYRQSPRKTRLVADYVRGKKVDTALAELKALPKRASDIFYTLIASAVANAENNFKVSKDTLMIKTIEVNKGVTLKRIKPRSRGMANRINKRTSNIVLSLAQAEVKLTKEKKSVMSLPVTKVAPKKAASKKVAK